MKKTGAYTVFAGVSSVTVMGAERIFCMCGECDMELIGYIFNDPISLAIYGVVFGVLCFLPSVAVKRKFGQKVAVLTAPSLIATVLAILFSSIGDNNPLLLFVLLVLVPLLAGNVVGLNLLRNTKRKLEAGDA